VVRPPRRAEFMQEEIDPLAGIEQLSPPDAA
jgi:hypothetical protein